MSDARHAGSRQRGRALWIGTALLVVAALLVAVPSASLAATGDVYVDRTVAGCSDTGPGSADVPLCTVATGLAALQPGGTLYIGDGTYAETVRPSLSGTATSPVTVTRWPGRSPSWAAVRRTAPI